MDFSTYSPAMDPNRIAPPSGPPASDQRKGRYSLDTPFKVPYNFAVPITVSIPSQGGQMQLPRLFEDRE